MGAMDAPGVQSATKASVVTNMTAKLEKRTNLERAKALAVALGFGAAFGACAASANEDARPGISVKQALAAQMSEARGGKVQGFAWDRAEVAGAVPQHEAASASTVSKWDTSAQSLEVSSSRNGVSTLNGFRWGIRSAEQQQGFRWGIRSVSDQQGFRWGLRSSVEQQGFRWGLRSSSDQQGFRWGISSNASEQGFRWGIR